MIKALWEMVRALRELVSVLTQIYGEINRIRLIIGEKSKTGKNIEEFDKKNNGYIPFFDSKKNYKKYKAMKAEKDE